MAQWQTESTDDKQASKQEYKQAIQYLEHCFKFLHKSVLQST